MASFTLSLSIWISTFSATESNSGAKSLMPTRTSRSRLAWEARIRSTVRRCVIVRIQEIAPPFDGSYLVAFCQISRKISCVTSSDWL